MQKESKVKRLIWMNWTYLNEVDLENTLSGPGQEDCALLTLHEREIEKAILSEDVLDKYTKVSCSDHASCVKCKILNERNHITEGDRYQTRRNIRISCGVRVYS